MILAQEQEEREISKIKFREFLGTRTLEFLSPSQSRYIKKNLGCTKIFRAILTLYAYVGDSKKKLSIQKLTFLIAFDRSKIVATKAETNKNFFKNPFSRMQIKNIFLDEISKIFS